MTDDAEHDCVCVYVTVPDEGVALTLARALVDERLVACVNDTGPVTSVYRWSGAIETGSERLLMMKTQRSRFAQIAARVQELHPYEVPEVIAVPIEAGHAPYLAWIREQTR